MARLHTTIESLYLVDGVRQSRALNVRAVEPIHATSQAVAKGNLYLLLELGGQTQPSPALYRLLLNTIQGVYYDAAGGVTGGITEAILAAHQALVQHNAVHPQEAQLGGVSCAVLRGDELYLGIGGPAVVLVHTANRVDQFPAELGDDIVPLGNAEAPAIELFRTSIDQTGTVVQLASEWMARVPAPKLATAALAPDLASATEYLEALAPSRTVLSALLVQLRPATSEEMAAATPSVMPPPPPPPTTEPVASPVLAVAADAPSLDGPPPEVDAEDEDAETDEIEETDGLEAAVAVAAATAATADSATAAQPQPVHPSPQATVPEDTQQGPESTAPGRRRWPLILAVLIPVLLVAAIAIALLVQQQRITEDFNRNLQGAQAAFDAAIVAGVPQESARSQLADAKERAQGALALVPGSEEAANLLEQIQNKLDEVNQIVPLYKLITLQPLGGEGTQPQELVMEGSRVFSLDQGIDRISQFSLDEASGLIVDGSGNTVVERGQILPDGLLVGELLDMTWAETGGDRRTSNLLVLDSNRNVLELDNATGIQPLAVTARDQWQDPRLIDTYNGNLYVLDVGTGRILRYRPSGDGYTNPPENYFAGDTALDLTGAIDMAIDGNIWVLYRDGTVQTFLDGRQLPFVLQPPPDSPISSPQALYVGSEAGTAQSIFIVDAGGGRILEYDKDGNYLRQFRPVDRSDLEKLRKMRDLHVDELDRTFYILASDAIYSTDIP